MTDLTGDGHPRLLPLKEDKTPYRFLVVDDSDFMLQNLERMLHSFGAEIVGKARDGMEAVSLYKTLFPNVDVVTMDITMPRMDGVESLEAIRAFDPKARVVMVSALGHADVIKSAVLKGAKHFIVKPFQREKVYTTLLAIL